MIHAHILHAASIVRGTYEAAKRRNAHARRRRRRRRRAFLMRVR